jgi:hypothetical protein
MDDLEFFVSNEHRQFRIREIEKIGPRRVMAIVSRKAGIEKTFHAGPDYQSLDRDAAIGSLLSALVGEKRK